ncbi:MAG: hypothetical protein IJZ75_01605 [Clostridia bacterium]|nr:hypothetical protein [Clostridia bacterium]
MKKFLSLCLCFCFILTLCGCKNATGGGSSFHESYYEYYIEEDDNSSSDDKGSSENSTLDNSSSVKPSSSSSQGGGSSTPSGSNQTVSNTNASVEHIEVDKEDIREPETEKIKEEIKIESHHTPLSASSYYQYSTLSAKEKEVYSVITKTAAEAKNVADISEFKLNHNAAYNILQKFIADNPQYFYISKTYLFTTNADTGDVLAIILCYTDGTVTDTFDDNLELVKTADRNIIGSKIEKFNKKIQQILENIPSNFSGIEKEKLIHDYIHKTVTYDYASANQNFGHGETLPHAFDIYGSSVNGKAVCEGYSKLFQYLCYCVGINATQIIGTADGGNHMWNGVNIDGKWYHIDVTWGDSGDYLNYSHFNLTTEKISRDHQIDKSHTAVPECSSTEKAAINTFIIYVGDLSSPPANYKTATDIAAKLKDKTLFVYFENPKMNGDLINLNFYQQYITKYFFDAANEVSDYIYNKGLTLKTSINGIGDMIYLTAE